MREGDGGRLKNCTAGVKKKKGKNEEDMDGGGGCKFCLRPLLVLVVCTCTCKESFRMDQEFQVGRPEMSSLRSKIFRAGSAPAAKMCQSDSAAIFLRTANGKRKRKMPIKVVRVKTRTNKQMGNKLTDGSNLIKNKLQFTRNKLLLKTKVIWCKLSRAKKNKYVNN